MDYIYKYLSYHYSRTPEKVAFVSLEGAQERCFSYADLYAIVQSKSMEIGEFETGETVLLLYSDTFEFLTSFIACQMQGLICIPMFFPNNKRHFERLSGIVKLSRSKFVLTSLEELEKVKKGLLLVQPDLEVVALKADKTSIESEVTSVDLAFIQYTSGSTSDPKGVVVSHKNLMHNQKMLSEIFNCTQDSIILSWLPFYHDMGLIGSLLHTLYIGCTCILMKPSSAVKSPLSWLQAIDKYKVTHSGGPNFIYDMCNALSDEQISSLDLTSWKVAYNGSEPVKAATVQNFTRRFSNCGLGTDAYRTCYGLAEATLLVSGGIPQISNDSITSGTVASEMEVIFYDNDTNEVNEKQGEICIHGDSVTSGYWQLESSEFFINHRGEKYFRTGDIGRLNNGQLSVDGRLKEMLILNGQNIFPYDLELAISQIEDIVLENGISVSEESGKLYVFAEVSRAMARAEKGVFQILRDKINKELIDTIGIESEAIVFLSPRSLPRTSSGKIRRNGMFGMWKSGQLSELAASGRSLEEDVTIDISTFEWSQENVEAYLIKVIQQKLKVSDADAVRKSNLFELGLSSIKAVEIVNKINCDLEIDLGLEAVFEQKNVTNVARHLLDMKWLSSSTDTNKEIEI